mgnify:CR=1 FL=1
MSGFITGRTSLTTVNSGDIANDAVTLAKLAAGTDGNLISFDTSGNPVAVAAGNDGQVLTSAGAGAVCLFEDAAAGGAWTKIGTVVASNDATLEVTGLDSTYDTYCIILADIVPITINTYPYIRVGDSGGVDSGASDYSWTAVGYGADASGPTHDNSAGAAFIQMTGLHSVGEGAGEGMGAVMYLTRPGDGTTQPMIHGRMTQITSGVSLRQQSFAGARLSVITLDRIQFLFNSGNVSTGRMTVWGISHA